MSDVEVIYIPPEECRYALDKLYDAIVRYHEVGRPVTIGMAMAVNDFRFLLGLPLEDEDELMHPEQT